jgi:hypothetical protein
MKYVELHVHYLRSLVHEHIVSLLCCRMDDQVVDIFTKSLSAVKFIKSRDILGFHAATIIGGCANVISCPKSIEHCANGGGVGTYGYDGSTQLGIF